MNRIITRRRFLRFSAAGLGLGAATGFYAMRIEPHWLEIVERPLPLSSLPEELAGWRLTQLSDLHVGPRVEDRYLVRCFDRVRDLAPELVTYTGDFTSHEPELLAHAERVFRHLPLGRQGTFGILGNHDYGVRWSQPHVALQIANLASNAGVQVLRNQISQIRGLHIIGLDDLWADQFNPIAAFSGLPADAPAVVLSHNPDTVDLPGWEAYSGWILSGHTHGGQCKAPFLPPPLLPVRNRRYTSGEFELPGGRRLYINRGVGHLISARFNVRPEVTVFRSRPRARPSSLEVCEYGFRERGRRRGRPSAPGCTAIPKSVVFPTIIQGARNVFERALQAILSG